jgi:hypothetical protein
MISFFPFGGRRGIADGFQTNGPVRFRAMRRSTLPG